MSYLRILAYDVDREGLDFFDARGRCVGWAYFSHSNELWHFRKAGYDNQLRLCSSVDDCINEAQRAIIEFDYNKFDTYRYLSLTAYQKGRT